MLMIEPLGEFPDDLAAQVTPYGRKTLELMDLRLVMRAIGQHGWSAWYNDELAFILGFVRTGSLLGANVELWFLAGKALGRLSANHWRGLRREFREAIGVYGSLTARVEEGFVEGHRFAKFFNMKPTHTCDGFVYYGAH